MKTRDPYQIIIMRPTGERAVMTIRSFWVKVFFIGLLALIAVLIIMAVWLAGMREELDKSRRTIAIQTGELKDLNLLLTHRDEEIISLKQRLSMSTIYQSLPEAKKPPVSVEQPSVASAVHPPFAGIKDLSLSEGELRFKVENVRPPSEGAARGYLFLVFKKQGSEIIYPTVRTREGIPIETNKGLPFTIRNFKPMSVGTPQAMSDWESVTFQIFDGQGNLRFSMPLDRKQIQ